MRDVSGVAANVSAWTLFCGRAWKGRKVTGRGSFKDADGVQTVSAMYHALSADEKGTLTQEAKRMKLLRTSMQKQQDPLREFSEASHVGNRDAVETEELGPWKLSCSTSPLALGRLEPLLADKSGMKNRSKAWRGKSGHVGV